MNPDRYDPCEIIVYMAHNVQARHEGPVCLQNIRSWIAVSYLK